MQFSYHFPDPALNEFVNYFWCLENESDEQTVTVLPDGYFDIMWIHAGNALPKTLLIGLATKARDYVVPTHSKAFAISFKLPAAESVLNRSIKTLLDKQSELIHGLWEVKPNTITSPEHFFSVAAESLVRLRPSFSDAKKRVLFDIIYSQKGNIKVAELAKLTRWDSRRINRYFRENFGLTLKSYCNILRFRSAFEHLVNGTGTPPEYFDQPHFIRDVRNYSGTSPKFLVANQNERFIQLSTLPAT